MAGKRRSRAVNDVPVPPEWFDVDAAVYALHAEMTSAPDVGKWRQLADRVAGWAETHSVELYPDEGGAVSALYVWDDTTGRAVRNH